MELKSALLEQKPTTSFGSHLVAGEMGDLINIHEYNFTVNKMREFFISRGFVEVPVQSRLSILAACEDPETVRTFEFGNAVWPLPQTGQVWLEYELLNNPDVNGVFCISTSYRDEQNPIEGRHDRIFPMFEFESRGTVQDLMQLEKDLLTHMGFTSFMKQVSYNDAAKFYGAETVEAEHENKMTADFAPIVFLTDFPMRSHPFWNMKQLDADRFAKVDVILHGMETIGSAERSCNPEEMKSNFHSVSNGQYANLLFSQFGKERVQKELESYLKLAMTPRFGAGIGVTRMIKALKTEGVLN
ncbi:MAG: amino acid--tRNA ligase-related protein [Nanoarchaeota archaeon]